MAADEATTWTRLHLVAAVDAELPAATGDALCAEPFDAVASVPGAEPIARRFAERLLAVHTESRLAVHTEPRLAVHPPNDVQPLREALADLASAVRGGEVLVVLDAPALAAAVALALGRGAEDGGADPAVWAAVDWPVPEARRARPKLAGLDLDWRPPRASGGREGFPGGTQPER